MTAPLKGNGIDVSALSLDELRELQQVVAKRIRDAESEEREAAFSAIEELAHRHGLSKADVAARFSRKRSRAPVLERCTSTTGSPTPASPSRSAMLV